MDLEMRDMNGEAMVAILGEFREAKIIILTRYASDVQGAINPGARVLALRLAWIKNSFGPYARFTPESRRCPKQGLALSRGCAHRDRSWITRKQEVGADVFVDGRPSSCLATIRSGA